jgi:hypothetical protein
MWLMKYAYEFLRLDLDPPEREVQQDKPRSANARNIVPQHLKFVSGCDHLRDGELQQPLPEKRWVPRYRTLVGGFPLPMGHLPVPNANPWMGKN